jgi:hypothetical protein
MYLQLPLGFKFSKWRCGTEGQLLSRSWLFGFRSADSGEWAPSRKGHTHHTMDNGQNLSAVSSDGSSSRSIFVTQDSRRTQQQDLAA